MDARRAKGDGGNGGTKAIESRSWAALELPSSLVGPAGGAPADLRGEPCNRLKTYGFITLPDRAYVLLLLLCVNIVGKIDVLYVDNV